MSLFKSTCLKTGVESSVPVSISFAIIFCAQGILSCDNGLSFWQSVCLTAGIFAAPTQAYIIENMDMPIWAVGINVCILNFKFFLMSTVLVALWNTRRSLAIPAAYCLTSSTYLVAVIQKKIKNPWAFFIGLAVTTYIVAISSTALGYYLCAHAIHLKSFLMVITHCVVPIHFVALTVKRKEEPTILILTMLGLVASSLLIHVYPKSFNILIWIMIAGICVLIEEKRHAKKLNQASGNVTSSPDLIEDKFTAKE